MDTEDMLLIGGVAVLVLLTDNPISQTLKGVGKGASDLSQGTASSANEITAGIASPFAFVDTLFDRLSSMVKDGKMIEYAPMKSSTTQEIINKGDTIFGMTGEKIVQNVEASARKSRNEGQKLVVTTPVYDSASGTGVNSAGYGYSSAFDLGAKGTGTGVNTFVNTKTGTTIKRNPEGIFANSGFS